MAVGKKGKKAGKISKSGKAAGKAPQTVSFGKFMRALERRPALRKKLITARAETLKAFGIKPSDYLKVQDAFATLRRFKVSVSVDFTWPGEADPSIIIDSISPNPIPSDTRTLVTIRGSNFPKNSEFGLVDRATHLHIRGEPETQDGVKEITGFIEAAEGQYELRVGTEDQTGALGNVIVGSDS